MTTPLSDADLKQIWARWEKGIETYDDLVAAGDDIPHLLVEVDRLRAEVERLRMALEAAKPKRPNYGPGKAWTYEGPPPEVWWAEKEATDDDATE